MARDWTADRVWILVVLVSLASAPAQGFAQSQGEASDPRDEPVARMGGDDLPVDGELRLVDDIPTLVPRELPAGPAVERARLEQAIRAGSAVDLHTLAQDLARIPGARALSRRASYEEARQRTARSPEWVAAMERAATLRNQVEQDERSVVAAARMALAEVELARAWPRVSQVAPERGLSDAVSALTGYIDRASMTATRAAEAYGQIARLRVPGAYVVALARQADVYRALVLSIMRLPGVLVPPHGPIGAQVEARISAVLLQRTRPVECFALLRYWDVLAFAAPEGAAQALVERATSVLRSAGRERLLECARDGSRDDIVSDAAALTQVFPAQRTLRVDESADARRP